MHNPFVILFYIFHSLTTFPFNPGKIFKKYTGGHHASFSHKMLRDHSRTRVFVFDIIKLG